MKRILALLLAATLVLPCVVLAAEAQDDQSDLPAITLGGQVVTLDEIPVEIDGNLLVPLQNFAKKIEAQVEWSYRFSVAQVTRGNYVVELTPGSDTAQVGGQPVSLPVPAREIGGSLYTPLRALAEGLNLEVVWDELMNTVRLTDKDVDPVDLGTVYTVVDITASEDDGNRPVNVDDRNYNTRWSAESEGAYITLELDGVQPVAYIGVAMYSGDERQETLDVLVSQDGENYQTVVSGFTTSLTRNMEAVPFDKTYDAKYVRVVGHGNTLNAWNSFAEIRIYGPYEGGGMPVATDGPESTAGTDMLTPEQQAAMAEVEKQFARIPLWFANLYDPETGGFYYAMSGKDNPSYIVTLQTTGFVLNSLDSYTDAIETMPEEVKQKFIHFFTSRQDPKTGYFVDDTGTTNSRDASRSQTHPLKWLKRWNVELPYPHPSQMTSDQFSESGSTAVMPDYVSSISAFTDWINNLRWEGDSWTSGDAVSNALTYIGYMDETQQEEYKNVIREFLAEHQDPELGLWEHRITPTSISGAFKVGMVYAGLGEQIPNADKVMNTIFTYFTTLDPDEAHFVRNPLSLLSQIKSYNKAYAETIQNWVTENVGTLAHWITWFQAPDGGFASRHGSAQTMFSGIPVCDGLWEGDVDSNSMIMTARKEIYNILGVAAPKMKVGEDLWKWISGEMETPSPYLDSKFETFPEEGGYLSGTEDFEGMDAGTQLMGTEFGAPIYVDSVSSIEMDPDRPNNKVLRVEGLGVGARYNLMGIASFADLEDITRVRYIPYKKLDVTAEFDIRFDVSYLSSSSFYVSLGSGPAYAVDFYGSNVVGQKISNRVSTTSTHYGGALATLNPNQWYRMKIEYHVEDDPKNFRAKIYVDDQLVSSNQSYYGLTTEGVVPSKAVYGRMNFVWYATSKGYLMTDNLRMTQKYEV